MEKKLTKREILTAILNGVETGNYEVDTADIINFCENEIDLLDKKAAKAKERQAEKKAAGDELTEAVKAALTDTPTIIANIAAKVAETFGEDATVAKVQYRLGQLANAGEAVRSEVKIPATETSKARTVKAFALA